LRQLTASDVISSTQYMHWDDSLLLALSLLARTGRRGPYRLPVLDKNEKLKGVIAGRRVLEVLMGARGATLRSKGGVAQILSEDVGLFCEEVHSIFSRSAPAKALAKYMVESSVGSIFVVDENSTLRGIVDETVFLERMRDRIHDVNASQIMTREVHTIGPDAQVSDAVKRMIDLRVRRLPVIQDDRLCGIMTVTDVLHHILGERNVDAFLESFDIFNFLGQPVKNLMVENVVTVEPEEELGGAASILIDRDVSALVVTSRNAKIEGVVARIDFLSGFARAKGMQALEQLVD
jgi:CBS-domain-containing membrane protein